jgi:hypothetical protein
VRAGRAWRASTSWRQEMPTEVTVQRAQARPRAARPPPTARATRAIRGPTGVRAGRAWRASTSWRQEMPTAVTVQRAQARPRAARPPPTAHATGATRGPTAARAWRAWRASTRWRDDSGICRQAHRLMLRAACVMLASTPTQRALPLPRPAFPARHSQNRQPAVLP